MLWIVGSGEGAARALSGQERGWGVAGCIMGMPECWVVEMNSAAAGQTGGPGAAAFNIKLP
jgi:hypothetical protein